MTENKKLSISERYAELKMLMMDSMSSEEKENHPLKESQLQHLILIHAINTSAQLQALNEKDEVVEFNSQWFKGKQGVYKIRYSYKGKTEPKQNQDKILLFRVIDQGDESIGVNFCFQGSEQLYSYQIKANDTIQTVIAKHNQELKKLISPKQQFNRVQQRNVPFLQPVPLNRPVQQDPRNRPLPLNRPQNNNNPFNNPFGQQEYVGPNSSIFANRDDQPGFGGRNPTQRYDPVDPFDLGNQGNPLERPGNQFMGFDQFGRPIQKKPNQFGGGFKPNRHDPFGGGFGGGGFGGGFGGNQNFF